MCELCERYEQCKILGHCLEFDVNFNEYPPEVIKPTNDEDWEVRDA